MKRIRIKNTPVEVTPICFGTSGLGHMPGTYGYDVSETQAHDTFQAIFESDVNFIDTSNNYGFGRSEARIGEALKAFGGLPEGFVISTKLDRDTETGRFDADRARRSLEESLTRLGLDRVQVLHLHDPEHAADLSEITRDGGAMDELFKIKEEGLADAVGLAMGKNDLMLKLLQDWPFDTLISHNRWTLINRSAEDIFAYAESQGMAILNAAPYAGGVLAKGASVMPRISYSPADEDALAPVRRIEALCAVYGVAPGAAALQFSMRDSRIASTICGVSRPERIRETLDWASAELPDALWAALDALPFDTSDPEAHRVYRLG
ncbi:MAG: aldo/keto reductase [Paracoccaceae bacterium]|nr:aldo/keto reductase [Paracoccaceae bacterium]